MKVCLPEQVIFIEELLTFKDMGLLLVFLNFVLVDSMLLIFVIFCIVHLLFKHMNIGILCVVISCLIEKIYNVSDMCL